MCFVRGVSMASQQSVGRIKVDGTVQPQAMHRLCTIPHKCGRCRVGGVCVWRRRVTGTEAAVLVSHPAQPTPWVDLS
eukprot:5257-Chlamydomonas_euryale.AAC.5